jgi:exodeoxyribonuclease VII large subunit
VLWSSQARACLVLPMINVLSPAQPEKIWGVAALVLAVSDALSAQFFRITLQGEISGFARAASGHCYLSLKDSQGGNALIRCAMFRRTASMLSFSPSEGQHVQICGRLSLYEPRGELQLVIETMQPLGAGALFAQFLQLRTKLEAEGLFANERKKTLPAFPRTIGVITSLDAAAWHDVQTTLSRRAPHVRLIVYPSLVQGALAPQALISALLCATVRAEVDVLILCRGGGSLQDLWAFNDETLVRSMAACPIAIVSGIGHETDISLADLVADLRAPTPTAAAELAAPAQRACLELLHQHARALARRTQQQLDNQAQRLDRIALQLRSPAQMLASRTQQLQWLHSRLSAPLKGIHVPAAHRHFALWQRLQQATHNQLKTHHQSLDALTLRLQSLNPRHILSQGYAWLHDEAGVGIGSVQQLKAHQTITATLVDGEIDLTVAAINRS